MADNTNKYFLKEVFLQRISQFDWINIIVNFFLFALLSSIFSIFICFHYLLKKVELLENQVLNFENILLEHYILCMPSIQTVYGDFDFFSIIIFYMPCLIIFLYLSYFSVGFYSSLLGVENWGSTLYPQSTADVDFILNPDAMLDILLSIDSSFIVQTVKDPLLFIEVPSLAIQHGSLLIQCALVSARAVKAGDLTLDQIKNICINTGANSRGVDHFETLVLETLVIFKDSI